MNSSSKTEDKIRIEIKGLTLQAYFCSSNIPEGSIPVDSHFHNSCEIYINVSGNVSFMVENRIYPIKSGDVIITRPYEKHHCIYHKPNGHDHYCIQFSPEGAEDVFHPFFNRQTGEGNLICLPRSAQAKLLSLCKILVTEKNALKQYIAFYSLVDLLSESDFSVSSNRLPDDVKAAVDYINSNFTSSISIEDLASLSHVTVNTLGRHFRACIGISPYAYIQSCRLGHARLLLEKGESVAQAAMQSGFPDYSHFIAMFKEKYGKTPLQMKKGL